MEPKQIIYVDHVDDRFFVWLNTSDDSRLENSFESYKDAAIFAQAWADGIKINDGVECEIKLNLVLPRSTTTNSLGQALEAEKLQAFANSIDSLTDTLTKLAEVTQTFAKVFAAIDMKRVYLGCAYSYNMLTRLKFLIKSPKMVSMVSSVIVRVFTRLPKWMILRWPLPELRD